MNNPPPKPFPMANRAERRVGMGGSYLTGQKAPPLPRAARRNIGLLEKGKLQGEEVVFLRFQTKDRKKLRRARRSVAKRYAVSPVMARALARQEDVVRSTAAQKLRENP